MWTPSTEDISTAAQREIDEHNAKLKPLAPTQLRIVMVHIGLSSADIEDRIDLIEDDTEREIASIYWNHAREYERHHWLVEHLRNEMGFDKEEFDALWIWGASV